MADLGDLLCQGKRWSGKVEAEMMDYGYVDKCASIEELRAILLELRGGTQGKYPHLEQHLEQKMLGMLPPRQASKLLAMAHEPSPVESYEAAGALKDWVLHQAEADARLRSEVYVTTVKAAVPPPRNATDEEKRVAKQAAAQKKKLEEAAARGHNKDDDEGKKAPTEQPIHGYDFRAWDKFDVDAECSKLEAEEKAAEDRVRAAKDRSARLAAKRREVRTAELSTLRLELAVEGRSPSERAFMAQREKSKGNEAYRAGESQEAYEAYSRALAFHESATLFANRAMACIKLNLLDRAEDDCSEALRLDPAMTKARARRGMTRHRRGHYAEAIGDLEAVLSADPDNSPMRKLLHQSRQKQRDVDGTQQTSNFVRVAIADDDDDDYDDDQPAVRVAIADDDEAAPPLAGGVRVAIADDDDDEDPPAPSRGVRVAIDEDEDEGQPAPSGGVRVAIDDDDDSEEEDPPAPSGGVRVAIDEDEDEDPPAPSGGVGVRVAIDDDDDSEEEDSPAPSGGVRVAIDEDEDEDPPAPSGGVRVAIDDDDDSEEEDPPAPSCGVRVAIDEDEDEDPPAPSGGVGVRVAIDDDDDSDEEDPPASSGGVCVAIDEDEDEDPPAPSGGVGVRVAIDDDDDSDEEDPPASSGGVCVAIDEDEDEDPPAPSGGVGVRVAIDDDDNSEEDPPAPSGGVCVAIDEDKGDDPPAPSGGVGVRVAIDDDEEEADDDEEAGTTSSGVRLTTEEEEADLRKRAFVEPIEVGEDGEFDLSAAKQEDSPSSSTTSWEVVAPAAVVVATAGEGAKERGDAAMRRGDVSAAEAAYTEAVDAAPALVAARSNRCQARLRLGDFAGAEEDATVLLADATESNPAVRVKALFRRGTARCELAKQLTPEDAAAAGTKARLLAGALVDLDECCKVDPSNEVGLAKLDEARRLKVAFDDDRRRGSSSSSSSSKDEVPPPPPAPAVREPKAEERSDAFKALGTKAMQAGDLEGAEAQYTLAIEAWAGNVAATNNRALARLKLGKFRGACDDATRVLALEPRNAKALYRRGVAAKKLGDFSAARDDLEALCAVEPKNKEAHAEVAAVRAELSKHRTKTPVVSLRDDNKKIASSFPLPPPPCASSSAPGVEPPAPPPPLPEVGHNIEAEATAVKRTAAILRDASRARTIAAARNATAVPKTAPKTAYELERVWKDLRDHPANRLDYVRTFDKFTLKKITSPTQDLFDEVVAVVVQLEDAPRAATVLVGASKSKTFNVSRAMLGAQELAAVQGLADKLDDGDTLKAALTKAYLA